MARIEASREDLLREATALIRRGEWRLPAEPEPVIAGIRKDGGLSVYFGDDPCWHFDAQNALRRSFCAGHLYRTQGDTLARLTRVRGDHSTELQRRDLTPAELSAFLQAMQTRLERFTSALQADAAELQRVVPDDIGKELAAELAPRLAAIIEGPRLASAIPTRRQ